MFEKLIKLRRFTESDMVEFCRQMFSAIEYIHSHNISHRDIKAENFLYAADGTVKLIEFGLAARMKHDNEIMKEIVGSAHYIAPEMLDRRYSKPVDIWSAGVLVYLMLYGKYPFDAETDEIVMRKVQIGGINYESPDFKPSATVSKFLRGLLDRDPVRRFGAGQCMADDFLVPSPEKSSSILVTGPVIDKLNEGIVLPAKSRKKDMLSSEKERNRSARILDIELQFEQGLHRGWRRTRAPTSVSAPTSPKGLLTRQGTKGLIQGGGSRRDPQSPGGQLPASKRSKSLPGEYRVTFDTNPPDVFVYTEGSGGVVKIGSTVTSPSSRRS